MNPSPALLLVLALVWMAATFRRASPRRSRSGDRFRHMAMGVLWRLGLPVPVLLLLAGRSPALPTMPAEFASLADMLGRGGGIDPWLLAGLGTGTLIGRGAAASTATKAGAA